jgi:hypothetical protein
MVAVCHRCEAPINQNQRQFGRADVEIAGTANAPTGGPHGIEIKNLGMGGLMFRSDRPYQVDDILRIQLPLEGDCFTIEAEVRHVEEDFEGYSVGVEFSTTSPPFIFKVHGLLKAAGAA